LHINVFNNYLTASNKNLSVFPFILHRFSESVIWFLQNANYCKTKTWIYEY